MKNQILSKIITIVISALVLSGCGSSSNSQIVSITGVDEKANSYVVGNIYDEFVCNGGLQATASYSNGSTKNLTKTEFVYTIQKGAQRYDGTKAFAEVGDYVVIPYASGIAGNSISIKVNKAVVTLDSIVPEKYTTQVYLNEKYTFDGTVTAKYSDGTTKNITKTVTFSDLDTSTLGPKSLTISYTENNITKSKEIFIDVVSKPTTKVESVTISPTSKTIEVDSKVTLTATVSPSNATNKTLTWSSTIPSVATVSSTGEVTALKAGTTTIKAKANDGSEKYGTCSITVKEKTVLVQSITLSKESTTIYTGKTETLTATVLPTNAANKNLSWSSSNTSVATVSSGKITAVKAGTATITATSKDGSNITASCLVTVETAIIPVTGISLPSTETLAIGGTKTLKITYTPSDATTGKEVTWSSDKTSIATVSSSGVVTGVAVGTAVITATSKTDSSITSSCTITVTEIAADKWTIMIYMCGSDLESEGGYATSDIEEILSVSNQPDDINIIIETGGSKSWKLSSSKISGKTSINASKLQRWHVADKKLVFDSELTKASMGLTSTFQSFLEWGINTYPADKTGVILWNHGGGLDGVCFDENYDNDVLENNEMKKAYKNAFTNTSTTKLEFVGFDACLMQTQDIADFNSDYFNYMVASQESEDGSGWDYDKWIDNLYNNDSTESILKEICTTFISSVGSSSDQTLSYLKLSNASSYRTAWENFANALKNKFDNNSVNKSTFASWAKNNVKNYCEDGYCGYGQFDAKDFVNKIASNSTYNPGSDYTNPVLTAISNYVGYNAIGTKAGKSNGVSCMYLCSSNTSYYSEDTNFTNWHSFNKSYGVSKNY